MNDFPQLEERISYTRKINKISSIIGADSYLEIGVKCGNTFFYVSVNNKYAVDPKFQLPVKLEVARQKDIVTNTGVITKSGTLFFEGTSDEFFKKLKPTVKFDIILLDGLHLYDQTYRDLCNSLENLNQRGFIIIDDIVPCDKYSAYRDQQLCVDSRNKVEPDSRYKSAWQGDVFKIVPFINLFHPYLDYCTVTSTDGFPQLVLWRRKDYRNPIESIKFPSIKHQMMESTRLASENINAIDFDWIKNNQSIFQVCNEESFFSYLKELTGYQKQ